MRLKFWDKFTTVDPSSMEIEYFRNITDRMTILKNSIERDVNELVERVLEPLAIFFVRNENRDQERREKIRRYFRDIYWTLRLHLFLHLEDPRDINRIRIVGEWGGLRAGDMEEMDDRHFDHFTDPASNLLELLSHFVESVAPRGSEEHARNVFTLVKLFLGRLQAENIFLPDVLVMVEHVPSERFSIGSSIAVSDFVKPISLYNRIINLKVSLAAAVMSFSYSSPLVQSQRHDYRFSYTFKSQNSEGRYDPFTRDLPCQNCRTLLTEDFTGEGGPTVLGACAEYCAVNELLPNQQIYRESPYWSDLNEQRTRNHKRCKNLLTNFREMSEKCTTALANGDRNEMEEVYWKVINLIHIFGLRPECNRYF